MSDHHIIRLSDPLYPPSLRQIHDPPARLHVRGTIQDFTSLLSRPRIAIVGSRKTSAYGRLVTERLAGALAGRGLVVVSGLAIGIDGFAHEATLAVGGRTMAVLAGGLDDVYPARHRDLAQRILDGGGVLVSEYAPGTPNLAHQFVARNRIISGLSDGVLVTEAAVKSGSLHTADFALEQGRPVMAVPGTITSPTSVGTNNLIRSGATLTSEAKDVLYALNLDHLVSPEPGKGRRQAQLILDAPLANSGEEAAILAGLQRGVTDGAELLEGSGLTAAAFNQALTMLEITGRIRPAGANHWLLR